MSFVRLLGILSIAHAATASPLILHEQRRTRPDSHTITLRFALASNNLPGRAEFRQWLSKMSLQVKSFVAPSTDAVNAFNAFTSANGLKSSVTSPYGEWVSVSLPVSKANQLFGAKFTNFTHTDLPAPIIRTLSVVHPTTAFTTPKRVWDNLSELDIPNRRRDATAPAECDTSNPNNSITPACLLALYNIPSTPATQQTNALLAFMKQFRPDLPSGANQTFLRLAIDGGTNPQFPNSAGTEAQLDIEYTAGVATNVPLQFLTPPTVMTTSYGDLESNLVPPWLRKLFFSNNPASTNKFDRSICNGYAAATARGVSVLFASGDVAVNFTGGATPDYQADAVAAFFKTLPANFTGDFNRTGRGYPDVSLQGWNFLIEANGFVVGDVSGTSASSPSVAAIIALVNDQLLAAGKPVLGFLNPFIYANPSALNDITIGHNSGFSCPENSAAFDAAEGWDPLSGLGTPDYQRLLAEALAA
ncbi:subtilisin-like protein [Mycena olivaceomarginata]|nr:subtilisin-like protein [Mycena olivaceomarginata]